MPCEVLHLLRAEGDKQCEFVMLPAAIQVAAIQGVVAGGQMPVGDVAD